jgi:hypothetical protein
MTHDSFGMSQSDYLHREPIAYFHFDLEYAKEHNPHDQASHALMAFVAGLDLFIPQDKYKALPEWAQKYWRLVD